jgi:CRP-like cAMP-binding protein
MAVREQVPSVSQVLPAASLDAARRLSGFTDELDARAAAVLASRLHHVSLPAGGLLFRQGEIGDAVYFVRSGRIAVLVTRDDGREIRVAEAGPDEIVGEMALVSAEPRIASARALRDSALLRFSKAAYEALIAREPDALEPFVRVMTERVARAARASQAISAIRSSSPVTAEECAAAAAMTDAPALHAAVRQLYHRIAADLATILGAQDVNWFAFASRSSARVGLPSRDDLAVLPSAARAVAVVLPRALVARLQRWRAIEHAATALDRMDARVAEGVRQLVADIAPAFVQLIVRCAEEPSVDRARAAPLAAVLATGTADRRGPDLVAEAVRLYDEASAEPDSKVRSELILLGTTKLALFEQLRLERLVPEAINDAFEGFVPSAAPWLARLPRWLHAEQRAQAFVTRLARRLVWSRLVRIRLPYGSLRRGDDLPRASARVPFAEPLSTLRNVELAALFAQVERGRGTRAIDWSNLADRMRYLTCLFRRHQRSLELFEAPSWDESAPDS